MDLPAVSAAAPWTGVVHPDGVELDAAGAPEGRADAVRCWVRGRPEGWARVALEHRIDPAPHPAQVLASVVARVGPARALAQLDGHWHALIATGDRATLVSSRMGTGRWWWAAAGDGTLRVADHPEALFPRGEADPQRLAARFAPTPRWDCPWPGLQVVPPGHLLAVRSGRPGRAEPWWRPPTPPEGRAGSRIVWDRAVRQALVLGLTRATREAPWWWVPAAPGVDDFAAAHAAVPPLSAGPPASIEAVLSAAAALPTPRLDAPGRRAAGGLLAAAAPGRLLVSGVGADRLLGAGFGRRAQPGAWQDALAGTLQEGTIGPLAALAARHGATFVPGLLHPAPVSVVGQVPWRHLRGLRGTLAGRLGLMGPSEDPWAPWLRGPGRARLQALAADQPDLGPLPEPDTPARAATALLVGAWRASG